MRTVSRRHFLAAASALAPALHASPLGLPIGCQLYPVRDALAKDFEGTLRELAGIGYKTIELCSPHGYANSGFGTLLNRKPAELRQTIRAAGLTCESSHYQMRELRESLDERIAYARELGLKQMIIASFGLPRNSKLSDWSRVADEANQLGERTRKAGLQLGFHNHNTEFEKIDGALIWDELVRRLDPKLVKFQFQVTVISLGFDPAEVMAQLPGRIVSIHLSDWSAQDKKSAPVGKGSINWKRVFGVARKAGVKNYYVEMNLDAMRESYPFLAAFKG